MSVTASATSSLFLGVNGNDWDTYLIYAGALVFVAAGAIGLATTGSITTHRRDAAAAKLELAHFQSEMAGKVADAAKAGIVAGGRSEAAHGIAEAAKATAAQANERAVSFEKETALARLETERIKEQVSWRDIMPEQEAFLVKSLSDSPLTVRIDWIDDAETEALASQISAVFSKAGVVQTMGSESLGGDRTIGLVVTGEKTKAHHLGDALNAAGIKTIVVEGDDENLVLKIGLKPRPEFLAANRAR